MKGAFTMAVETYNVTLPRTIYSGKNALSNLKTVVAGAKKVAIFTDKGILSTGLVELPLIQLKEAGVESVVISDLPPEPTYTQVQKLVDEFKASGADFIVAVGGGSAMDAAKLASLLATESYTVKDLLDNPGLAVKTVKTCLIPTTAGTGSEVTLAAVITDEKSHYKYPINDFALIPRYAVHDWRLTRGLPPAITGQTGMDALTHAVEAYIGRGTTRHTRRMATEAVRLVHDNLLDAYRNGGDERARTAMMEAAYKAGVAFTQSYVGYVHAIAHSLGGQYGTKHFMYEYIHFICLFLNNIYVMLLCKIAAFFSQIFGKTVYYA